MPWARFCSTDCRVLSAYHSNGMNDKEREPKSKQQN
jgi:hypothetical protein